MKKWLLVMLTLIMGVSIRAETIDVLVAEALRNNLSILQSDLAWQTSLLSVDKAKGRLLPQLSFSSRLSFAGGGRQIEFPVGDMLNPILRSVNSLYRKQGDVEPFDQMFENMGIPFLRSMEQETRLRLTLPLVQTSLWHGIKIERSLSAVEVNRHQAQMRELVYQVRNVCYQVLRAEALGRSVQTALEALTEHLHLAESLVKHGAATEDVSAQARAALAAMRQKEIEVARGVELARRQLNLLLHRDLSASLQIEEPENRRPDALLEDEALLRQRVLDHREELVALNMARQVYREEAALHRDRLLPSLVVAADYGFQGEKYIFDGDHDYWMASLVLEWPLFDGGERRLAKRQAELRGQAAASRLQEVSEQLLLQLADALLMVRSSRAEIEAAKLAQESARMALEIIKKRYGAGQALQLELLSAQASWVDMNEKWIMAQYAAKLANAKLERVAALYELPSTGDEK